MNKNPINTSQDTDSGKLFIISAPSGAGKTTLCRAILNHFPQMRYSISYTTRPPRPGEENGVDYHFFSKTDFEIGLKNGQWAEWATVHGNYYGTNALFVENELASGRDILLDIDVQGAKQVLNRYPNSVAIFIMPPSMEILKKRLLSRDTDSHEDIETRLNNAESEIAQKELYLHVVVNDELSLAIKELIDLISYHSGKKANS
jgi:guanylate kinase